MAPSTSLFQGRRRILYPHLSGAYYFPLILPSPCPLPSSYQTDHQRWIYRVDYSRVNEYGQVNEGMVEPVGEGAVKGEKVKEIESKKTK
jgi:hypothetical protein